jgi:hypothetical protein
MTLIAEDLLLLLLDDEKGTLPAVTSVDEALGGAVLVELALMRTVDVRKGDGAWGSETVHATGAPAPDDPVLRDALAVVEEKERTAQDLVARVGKGLREMLSERLVERGFLERRDGRVLGIFPRTRWPAVNGAHETDVRRGLSTALVHGVTPDDRTAALVALLHALDRAHLTVDTQGVGNRTVKQRAKDIAEGDWAAKAVSDTVQTAMAAMVAVTTVTTAASG